MKAAAQRCSLKGLKIGAVEGIGIDRTLIGARISASSYGNREGELVLVDSFHQLSHENFVGFLFGGECVLVATVRKALDREDGVVMFGFNRQIGGLAIRRSDGVTPYALGIDLALHGR